VAADSHGDTGRPLVRWPAADAGHRRALTGKPKRLPLDESSLGLSPLLVEPNAGTTLEIAGHDYAMETRCIVHVAKVSASLKDPKVKLDRSPTGDIGTGRRGILWKPIAGEWIFCFQKQTIGS
jgi:hypothetical protein